jgi:bla regulator protein blaR1
MTRIALSCALACLAVGLVRTQAPPAFEVASIRINKSGDQSRSIRSMPGGRLQATNVPLRNLIRFAYEVLTLGEITGGPDWMESAAFDIVAKGDAEESQPSMMRALLAERFKLAVHREMREQALYALTLARTDKKLGPALTPSTADCSKDGACYRRSTQTRFELKGQAIPQLARTLNALVGETVVDRTGLVGAYDMTVEFSPEQLPGMPRAPADPNLPSLFTALQEQLGLKLERSRGSVEVLVVDHAEMPVLD